MRGLGRKAAVASLGLLGAGALVFAAVDLCRRPEERGAPRIESGRAEGALRAGMAEVPLHPPYPVVIAGYPPLREVATSARREPRARALVLEVGKVRVALVSLDLQLVPEALAVEVERAVRSMGISELWLSATHTHSSFGGYHPEPLFALAATGPYRAEAREAVVTASVEAVRAAVRGLAFAALSLSERDLPGLVVLRSGPSVDARLTRLAVRHGAGLLGQALFFSAHPTLAGRHAAKLDPDYIGVLAEKEAEQGRGVTVFLNASGGNASAAPGIAVDAFGAKLSEAVAALPPSPWLTEVPLAFARADLQLPAPDATHLVPRWLGRAGRNALCQAAPRLARVAALQLGPLRLISLPGEPTAPVARALEAATSAQRTVGLTNGYLGYIEAPGLVDARDGEFRRQYFDRDLASQLTDAAVRVSRALSSSPPGGP